MLLQCKHTAQLLTAWHNASFIAFYRQRVTPLSWDYSKYQKVLTAVQLEIPFFWDTTLRHVPEARAPHHVLHKVVIFRRPSREHNFRLIPLFKTLRAKRRTHTHTHTTRCSMKEIRGIARFWLAIFRLKVVKRWW
jgi:hypothetical protein